MSTPMDEDIGETSTFEELSRCLDKKMKPFYPDGDLEGWQGWVAKYSDIDLAKRAANHMFKRLAIGGE
jgi:hypothetical protein